MKAGVSFVAAAGNSGSVPYIVGAPSTAVEAFSVAAGIDDMLHTTQVDASKLSIDGAEENIISVFGSFSKKLEEGEVVSGEIVYVGLANEELNAELAAAVKGKIALVDRGGETFAKKSANAFKAGAIGIALANNKDEEPSTMSGDEVMTIPVVMISKAHGQKIQEALKAQKVVTFSFSTEFKFSRSEFIDTITGFSSRGPRSEDGLIKPEIVAPGQQITSAKAGGGNKGERLNGTSMASPHMAGVMALIKQRFPNLSVLDHKHILMSTAKIISNEKGVRYPVMSQGAGRVDVMKALNAKLLPSKGSFSLGKVDLFTNQVKEQQITLTNLTSEEVRFSIKTDLTSGLTLNEASREFTIQAGGKLDLNLNFNLNLTDKDRSNYEGFIKLVDDSGKLMASFPVLAVIHQSSEIVPVAVNNNDSNLSVMLKNNSTMKGSVLPFNLIDTDVRKPDLGALSHIRSRACDIKSAGYRFVTRTEKVEEKEEKKVYLQLGVKLYESVSSWEACEVSVLIDSDNDGTADQEWIAAQAELLPGLNKAVPDGFYSYLLDAHKARALRDQFEVYQRLSQGGTRQNDEMRDTSEIKNEEGKVEDYRKAVISLNTYVPYNMSSVSVMEIELGALAKTDAGTIKFKMASIDTNESSTQLDDFLAGKDKWHSINVNESEIKMMPEEISLEANESKKVDLAKSESSKGLVLYSPTNSDGKRDESKDLQEIILK
ncbi:S8 family serine peptidase [Peredibacter sp. HCB2-198]|uniref:S8 family serine peptidase n=1 Tax=Peredibacter sp. HCB2-198 TaxID=3383025 RepID=UPI0038B4998E